MADDLSVFLRDNITAKLRKLDDFLFETLQAELGKSGDE